jgi:hypothetical protein
LSTHNKRKQFTSEHKLRKCKEQFGGDLEDVRTRKNINNYMFLNMEEFLWNFLMKNCKLCNSQKLKQKTPQNFDQIKKGIAKLETRFLTLNKYRVIVEKSTIKQRDPFQKKYNSLIAQRNDTENPARQKNNCFRQAL